MIVHWRYHHINYIGYSTNFLIHNYLLPLPLEREVESCLFQLVNFTQIMQEFSIWITIVGLCMDQLPFYP